MFKPEAFIPYHALSLLERHRDPDPNLWSFGMIGVCPLVYKVLRIDLIIGTWSISSQVIPRVLCNLSGQILHFGARVCVCWWDKPRIEITSHCHQPVFLERQSDLWNSFPIVMEIFIRTRSPLTHSKRDIKVAFKWKSGNCSLVNLLFMAKGFCSSEMMVQHLMHARAHLLLLAEQELD